MSLALNEAQFAMFIQLLKQESADSLTIRKVVARIGQQHGTELWVLGEGMHIDAQSALACREEQVCICLDWSVQQGLSNEQSDSHDTPSTQYHDSSQTRGAPSCNHEAQFIPVILMVAGGVISLHYSTII